MTNASTDFGKLHLILELIDRRDIRTALNEKFSEEEQKEIFKMFKDIMADEITFVMNIKEVEQQQQKRLC